MSIRIVIKEILYKCEAIILIKCDEAQTKLATFKNAITRE